MTKHNGLDTDQRTILRMTLTVPTHRAGHAGEDAAEILWHAGVTHEYQLHVASPLEATVVILNVPVSLVEGLRSAIKKATIKVQIPI